MKTVGNGMHLIYFKLSSVSSVEFCFIKHAVFFAHSRIKNLTVFFYMHYIRLQIFVLLANPNKRNKLNYSENRVKITIMLTSNLLSFLVNVSVP